MLSTAFLLLAAGLSGFASAQNNSADAAAGYPYLLDPNDPLFTAENRSTACTAQLQSCPQLCPNGAAPNTCEASTLTYTCKCNGETYPNVTAFEQTLPFFECQQYVRQCVARTNDAAAQQACLAIKCGVNGSPADYASSISMSRALASPTSSAVSSTATSAPASQTPAPSASPSPSQGAAPTMGLGKTAGTGALVAGIFGGFAFML